MQPQKPTNMAWKIGTWLTRAAQRAKLSGAWKPRAMLRRSARPQLPAAGAENDEQHCRAARVYQKSTRMRRSGFKKIRKVKVRPGNHRRWHCTERSLPHLVGLIWSFMPETKEINQKKKKKQRNSNHHSPNKTRGKQPPPNYRGEQNSTTLIVGRKPNLHWYTPWRSKNHSIAQES